jgi:Flp pilus assembly protein TadG
MRPNTRKKQKGAVAVFVAAAMVMLLSFAALALDIGNLMVAKNELQNAADAAALAAAPCLYPRAVCGNATVKAPDWATAEQKARDSVSMNVVQGGNVKVGVSSSGYWNITGNPAGLQVPPVATTVNDLPAVRVTITKSTANNNGPVRTFLAGLFGVSTMEVSAVATAVVAHPGSVGPGGLFPFALSSCLFNTYWDSATHTPKLAPNNNPLPGQTQAQVTGQPYIFQAGSSYHIGTCEAGQWTTFNQTKNDVPHVEDLMLGKNANPNDQVILGDPTYGKTYIQPGTENVLFKDADDCSASGNKKCEWATVPIVDSLTSKTYQTVNAFACVHILSAKNGSSPYIVFQMARPDQADNCQTKNAGGSGPDYGAQVPPRLVQ